MLASNAEVESLLEEVDKIPDGMADFELWVPIQLTLAGNEVTADVAMAIVLDSLLRKGFMPDGFVQGLGGRTYRYRREILH